MAQLARVRWARVEEVRRRLESVQINTRGSAWLAFTNALSRCRISSRRGQVIARLAGRPTPEPSAPLHPHVHPAPHSAPPPTTTPAPSSCPLSARPSAAPSPPSSPPSRQRPSTTRPSHSPPTTTTTSPSTTAMRSTTKTMIRAHHSLRPQTASPSNSPPVLPPINRPSCQRGSTPSASCSRQNAPIHQISH